MNFCINLQVIQVQVFTFQARSGSCNWYIYHTNHTIHHITNHTRFNHIHIQPHTTHFRNQLIEIQQSLHIIACTFHAHSQFHIEFSTISHNFTQFHIEIATSGDGTIHTALVTPAAALNPLHTV